MTAHLPRSCAGLLPVAVLVSLASAPVGAHEWWIEPTRYAVAAGDTVALTAFAGMGFRGERKEYRAGRVTRVALVDGGTVHERAPDHGSGGAVFARVPGAAFHGGAALAGLETGYAHIELEADEFAAYLADEGLDTPLAARRAEASRDPVRERYARCARTWLRNGAGASTPSGLTLEIVPLAVAPPTGGGRALPVRVLLRGRPLAGALLKAWRRDLAEGMTPFPADARDSVGVAARTRTDPRGRAWVPITGPGEWMLAAVHMERSGEPAEADWQSFWATLTFAVPATR